MISWTYISNSGWAKEFAVDFNPGNNISFSDFFLSQTIAHFSAEYLISFLSKFAIYRKKTNIWIYIYIYIYTLYIYIYIYIYISEEALATGFLERKYVDVNVDVTVDVKYAQRLRHKLNISYPYLEAESFSI